MAKSKWPQVEEKLVLVEKWARDGLSEQQIADNLGISHTTCELYKKTYPDFSAALKRGKEPFIAEVENALARRARGFSVQERKTYIKHEADGGVTEYTEVSERYFPPDVAACSLLLKNKDKGSDGKARWSDNPAKIDIERELAELRKRIEQEKVW